jgi:putative transposase
VIYGFVEADKANHSIGSLCRVLRVSKSGYYDWKSRPPSARFKADAVLTERIERIHRDSRATYGARPACTASCAPQGSGVGKSESHA